MNDSKYPTHDSQLARAVAEFCSFRPKHDGPPSDFPSDPSWKAITASGSRVWLDSADRDANVGVWTAEFTGLTTNNTLLNKVIQNGDYDDLVPEAAGLLRQVGPAMSQDSMVREIAFMLNVIHAKNLSAVFDCDVSVELHTDLVRDVAGSYAYGKRVHEILPEHAVVKIALTPEGLLVARLLEQDGVRVNLTLGFSPRQNQLIATFACPHFVNVFLGRVSSFFRESGIPVPASEEPGIVATIQSQRALRELIGSGLAESHTRQIAASMREATQVPRLAGVDVLTMPVAVAGEFVTSGIDADLVEDRTSMAPVDVGAVIEQGRDTAVFFVPSDAATTAARELLERALKKTLDADQVLAVLSENGLGALFPRMSDSDRGRLWEHGKIPRFGDWEERVSEGSASWDGLLTEAAIGSFARDQRQLDDRIRSQLG